MVARISGKAERTKLLSCVPMPPKREGAQDQAMEQEKLKRCAPKLVACAMTWEPQTGSVSYHETSNPRHYWLCQNSKVDETTFFELVLSSTLEITTDFYPQKFSQLRRRRQVRVCHCQKIEAMRFRGFPWRWQIWPSMGEPASALHQGKAHVGRGQQSGLLTLHLWLRPGKLARLCQMGRLHWELLFQIRLDHQIDLLS